MDKEDIIRMAREAGWGNLVSMPHITALERFATLVAAAEREALLDLVDDYAKNNDDLKAAIRARGQA